MWKGCGKGEMVLEESRDVGLLSEAEGQDCEGQGMRGEGAKLRARRTGA
jgi:hypothetical protein